MALAHSFYVKTEAQRRVKFSAVLKPVSAKKKKKFYLCKFLIVNLTSVGNCKNTHQILSNVLCGS